MRRWVVLLLSTVVCAGSSAVCVRAAGANGGGTISLTVPPGFVVERVAGPPLVERPIMACFDERGRLYVADSAGLNLPAEELVKNPSHRIVVLQDTDGDGRFDRSSVFADKLVSPRGLLWHDGAVFVASPPSLWRLRDSDGDGAADERKELITGFALTGASDDVGGACLGPDGYVYTCAGAVPHDLKDLNGKPLHKGTAPLLVRCRPDGSNAEVVGGLHGKPVEAAWSAQGDVFVSGSSFGGEGLRDAVIHSVEGGDYPVVGFSPEQHEMKRTGGLLPALVHTGAASPTGLMRYRGFTLGRPFTGNLVCAYFNGRKVQRHLLEPYGSTFRARAEDLVVSSAAPSTSTATSPGAAPSTAPASEKAAGVSTTAPTSGPASQPSAGAPVPQPPAVPPPPPLPPSPAVPALLDAFRDGPDRFLEHAVVYALIRIADRESTAKGLNDADPSVRRGATLALDQIDGPGEPGGAVSPQGLAPPPDPLQPPK